ncbi:MAG TPA: MFS transporter, partial [Ottowia sp.]|nr:MFS transporter [Ottowia sp.]
MSTGAPADASLIDSRTAAWRLLVTVLLVTLGNSAMYVVSVVLPAVQSEFGISRANASLPYTFMMVCLGLGGLFTGRWADRFGIARVLWLGSAAVLGGYVLAALSGNVWMFGLAHGLLGLLGGAATFAPLMADTGLWWNKRRGIAMAVCASGNYIAGTLWPPLAQWGITHYGWRPTYIALGLVCGIGMALLAFYMRRPPPALALPATGAAAAP